METWQVIGLCLLSFITGVLATLFAIWYFVLWTVRKKVKSFLSTLPKAVEDKDIPR